jgi:segregation and condensation protein A
MAEENSAQLGISLPRYDGPFDLLLALIRRHEYPIDALPVLEITSQFLAYVKAARDLDAELGGEFVEVASWLVLLKSRSLLPAGNDGGPSPREELRRAVLDHETLRAATEFLRDRGGRARPGSAGAPTGRGEAVLERADDEAPTIQDVLEAAGRALEAARAARSFEETEGDNVTVEELVRWIGVRLASIPARSAVSTEEWFQVQPSDRARAALFLALLELARKGVLLLHQEEDFAPIRTKFIHEISEYSDIESLLYESTQVVAG